MSKTVTVRDVPQEVTDELSARAARGGRSLQEYLRRHLIDMTSRPDPEEWAAAVRARTQSAGDEVEPQQILAWRDSERP